jgi:hypothetical protein
MKFKFLSVFLLVFTSLSVSALECERPIKSVFTGWSEWGNRIVVDHDDGGGLSYVTDASVGNNPKLVDRILSTILAAHMGGKRIKFISSGHSCTSKGNQKVEAVWIL